jgi:CheY-like chemotaxis protein
VSLKPILVGEDDPDDVLLLKRVFNLCRVSNPITVVPDGKEVIAYLSGAGQYADRNLHPLPAMLLLDLFMQPVTGIEVLQWIRNNGKPEFPVVILTGWKDLSEMTNAYRLGAHSFLVKPLDKPMFFLSSKNLETSKLNR